MKRNHRLFVSLLAAIALLSSVAQGATFIVPSDRDLVRQSDAIVIGKVMARHSGLHPDFEIATFNEIEVVEWIKGRGAERVTIVEMGGALAGRIKAVPGGARFTPDERVVLFLKRNGRGEWASLNMALGKFSFVTDEDGRRLLLRSMSDEEIYGWTPAGKRHQEQSRFEEGFLRFIRSTVAGVSAEDTYFVPASAGIRPRLKANEITVTAANDYLLTTNVGGVPGCVGSIGGFRWQIFDTGASDPPGCGGGVCYQTNGSQTGQTDSLGSTNRGIAAWVNEPNSDVVAGVIGTTTVAAPNGDDGVNTIIFNYNGPEWTSNPGAIGLGLVNANACYQRGGENFVATIDGDVIIKNGVVFGNVADFDGLMCHETGHTFGFRHSDSASPSSNNAVMRTILVNGLGANLQSWDIEAVQSVYGAGPVCVPVGIAQQPTANPPSVPTGSSTNLIVSASGSAPHTYQWFRGNPPDTSSPVSGATSATSNSGTLTEPTTFWVKITNCLGVNSINSAGVSVAVTPCPAPPITTGSPADASVQTGGSTTLTVFHSGVGPFTYQWFRGEAGDTSSGVVGSSATLNTGALTTNTRFWVRVREDCGAFSDSRSALVTVETVCTSPSISVHPANTTVQTGGSTNLTVMAGGTGLQYQWYRGQSPSEASPIAGANGASFNTGALTTTQSFWVKVFQSCSSSVARSNTATVTVGPSIVSFDASPMRIRAGESTTLLWSTNGATSVTIDPSVGTLPVNGSVRVTPAATTTYTLVAMNSSGGASSAQVTIEVITAPSVAISVFPNGLLQEANTGGGTDRFVVTNSGGSATTITLTQNGNFFTQSPTSFTLNPGASQVVIITGVAQPPGTVDGASTLSGNGVPSGLSVPIRLLSVIPPTVQVTADALEDRVDLSAIGATNPSGSTLMVNNSSIALTGIVVSDVPWIIPPTEAVTIPAGGTVTISFTIDRSKRPDASAPIGSLAGNLTLAYLSGAGAGARQSIQPLGTTSVNQFTSVKVIDTASVAANPSSLGPLAPGQLALFAPGMTRRAEGAAVLKSDVAFSNLSSANLAGLNAFFTPGVGFSAISTLANIPQIVSNQPLAFSDLVKSLYNAEGQEGTLQVRASDAVVRNLTLSAMVVNTNDPQGAVGTFLPVFRSDRVGNSVTLTGLRPETTNLILQETSSANNTSVKIDFYNASGNPVGAGRTELLERFKMRDLASVVPATAVSAVLTSTGSGTFAAYGAVQDTSGRGDDLAVVDWPGYYGYSTSQPVLIPIAGGSPSTPRRRVRRGSGAPVDQPLGDYRRTDVTIMNVGTATASGKLVYYSASGQPLERQLSLASREARQVDDVTAFVGAKDLGYVIFQPEGGSFVVTARATTSTGLSATVPTIGTLFALKAGEVHKVGGLEDASQSSISKKRGSTSRTDVGLIETAGHPVTVRVTLHYSFAASDRVGARGSASREYALQPRQMLLLHRISRELLGVGRDQTFGDMRDLQLEFAIVQGDGEVIQFISSIDNGSGDAFVRVD